MKTARTAFLISLCLHLIFLIVMAILLYRKIIPYSDESDVIVTDLVKIPIPRAAAMPEALSKMPEFSIKQRQEEKGQPFFRATSSSELQTPIPERPIVLSVTSNTSNTSNLRNLSSQKMPESLDSNPSNLNLKLTATAQIGDFGFRIEEEKEELRKSALRTPYSAIDHASSRKPPSNSVISALTPSRNLDYANYNDRKDETGNAKTEAAHSIPDLGKPLKLIAQHIISQSKKKRVDVVFAIDYSGSMGDNINAVNEHLSKMIDVYEAANSDYALGLIQFHTTDKRRNVVKVLDLTKNLGQFRSALSSMFIDGDEHALDAIMEGMHQIKFRSDSEKHLILMTDEPFSGSTSFETAVRACNEFWVSVNVLGLDDSQHKDLASLTNGIWELIPESRQRGASNTYSLKTTKSYPWRLARSATWSGMSEIINHILEISVSRKLDLIILVDTSRSMEEKVESLTGELKRLVQALEAQEADFQVGAVRFRSSNATNYINVYQPPQSLEQLEKILQIPYQDDEEPLEAILETLRRTKFRSSAKRLILLITDEPLKNENQMYSIIAACQREAVELNILGAVDDKQKLMANMTGGLWALIPDSKKSDVRW